MAAQLTANGGCGLNLEMGFGQSERVTTDASTPLKWFGFDGPWIVMASSSKCNGYSSLGAVCQRGV